MVTQTPDFLLRDTLFERPDRSEDEVVRTPGVAEATGASVLNALINLGQAVPNQFIIPFGNEPASVVGKARGLDREQIPQTPLLNFQDLPNPFDPEVRKEVFKGGSLLQSPFVTIPQNVTRLFSGDNFKNLQDRSLSIREASEGRDILDALVGGTVELLGINELVGGAGDVKTKTLKPPTGKEVRVKIPQGRKLLQRGFPGQAILFGGHGALSEFARQQERRTGPDAPLRQPLVIPREDSEFKRGKEDIVIPGVERPLGVEQSTIFGNIAANTPIGALGNFISKNAIGREIFGDPDVAAQGVNFREPARAFVDGSIAALVFRGVEKAVGAAAKKGVLQPSPEFKRDFNNAVLPGINAFKRQFSQFAKESVDTLVDDIGTRSGQIFNAREELIKQRQTLVERQLAGFEATQDADITRTSEIVDLFGKKPKGVKGKEPSFTLKNEQLNKIADEIQKGELKPNPGQEELFEEIVNLASRNNQRVQLLKTKTSIDDAARFLEGVSEELNNIKDPIVKFFQETGEKGDVTGEQLKSVFSKDAREVLEEGIEKTLKRRFGERSERLQLAPSTDTEVQRNLAMQVTEETVENFTKLPKHEAGFTQAINDYVVNPLKFRYEQMVDPVKQKTARILFGAYDQLRHAADSGDSVAKVIAPALNKARAFELETTGRYAYTPIRPGGKSIVQQMEELGVVSNSTPDKALDWVARYTPYTEIISKDGTVELSNRQSLTKFKNKVKSNITKFYKDAVKSEIDFGRKAKLLGVKEEGLARVEQFFNPDIPPAIATNIRKKGVLDVTKGSVEEYRQAYDLIPDKMKEVSREFFKGGIFGGTDLEARVRFQKMQEELIKSGLKKNEVDLYVDILRGHSKLSPEEELWLTSSKMRFTPKHLELLEDDINLMRNIIPKEEGLPQEILLDAYLYQGVTKEFKALKQSKTVEELLEMKPSKELFQEMIFPFEKKRTKNIDIVRSFRDNTLNRINQSARYQTLHPMRKLLLEARKSGSASQYVQDVSDDLAKRLFGLDRVDLGIVEPIYGALSNVTRNLAGKALATARFPLLNTGQLSFYFAEKPGLLPKTVNILKDADFREAYNQATTRTGITSSVADEEFITALTGIRKGDASSVLGQTIDEGLANAFKNAPDGDSKTVMAWLMNNPALNGSENLLSVTFGTAGVLNHFKGDTKAAKAFVNKIASGQASLQERRLFNNLVVETVSDNAFTLNTEFNRSVASNIPVAREALIFTTFTFRGLAKMAHWLDTNPEAFARYAAFVSAATGSESLDFFSSLQDKLAEAQFVVTGKKPNVGKARDKSEVIRRFEEGEIGRGPSRLVSKGIAKTRQLGRKGQESIFGTDITPSAASQAFDFNAVFPFSAANSIIDSIHKNPEEGKALFIDALIPGTPFVLSAQQGQKIIKGTKGIEKVGRPKASEGTFLTEEVDGVRAFDPISGESATFKKSILNPERFSKASNVARTLNVSGFKERLSQRASEIIENRKLFQKMLDLQNKVIRDPLNTEAQQDLASVSAQLNLGVKSYIRSAHASGDFVSVEAIREDLFTKLKGTERNIKGQEKQIKKAKFRQENRGKDPVDVLINFIDFKIDGLDEPGGDSIENLVDLKSNIRSEMKTELEELDREGAFSR